MSYEYLLFHSHICTLKSAPSGKQHSSFCYLHSSVIYATIYIIEIKSFKILLILILKFNVILAHFMWTMEVHLILFLKETTKSNLMLFFFCTMETSLVQWNVSTKYAWNLRGQFWAIPKLKSSVPGQCVTANVILNACFV